MSDTCKNCNTPTDAWDTRPAAAGWHCYDCGAFLGRRLPGLRARDSRDAARHDGGAGVVADADGRRVYWS